MTASVSDTDPSVPEAERPGLFARLQFGPFAVLTWLMAAGIMFLILYPLLRMVGLTFFPGGVFNLAAIIEVLTSSWFPVTILNTVILVVAHGVLALVIGAVMAWLNERTDARLGMVGDIMPLVPLLLPAIALAIGWIFLASTGAGFLNQWLAFFLEPLGIDIRFNIVSWPGLVFVYTLNAVPYVYLIVGAALRNLDSSLEEAARTSGAGLFRTFRTVSLPAIKPALIASSLLVVILGMSHFSIAIIIANRARIDLISVRIMRLLTIDIPPSLAQATVVSLFLLIMVTIMWVLQRKVLAKGNYAMIGGKNSQRTVVRLGPWRWVAWTFIILYILCAAVLPLFALLVVALQPFWTARIDPTLFTLDNFRRVLFEMPVTRDAFRNSLMLAAGGAAAAMMIAAITVIYTRSAPKPVGAAIGSVLILPAALSHLAIAVGFLVAFAGAPFFLGGTLWMLFLVYIVLYMPEASITSTAAASQVGQEMVEAARVSGVSEGRTFLRITLPLMAPGLISGFALVFVLMAGEVTASSLLAKIGSPVIGFAIRDIWESGTFGNLAALAGAFTLLNIFVVLIALKLGRGRHQAL